MTGPHLRRQTAPLPEIQGKLKISTVYGNKAQVKGNQKQRRPSALHWWDRLHEGILSWWAHPLLIFSSKRLNQTFQQTFKFVNTQKVLLKNLPVLHQAGWQMKARGQSPVWSSFPPSNASVEPTYKHTWKLQIIKK